MKFTAQYTEIKSGFMGQILEWPEVVTEAESIDACKESLYDALQEMIIAHKEQGIEPPIQKIAVESLELL